MDEQELQDRNQEAQAAAEEAGGQAGQAPAEVQPMQPMQNEGENDQQGQEAAAENAGDQEAQAEAAAEEAGNQAQEVDPQEAQEEGDEQEEQGGDPQNEDPQNVDAKAQEANLAGDEVNMDIANIAAEVGIEDEDEEDQGDPDRAFDTLDDLKKLNGENDNGNEEGGGENKNAALKKKVNQLRKGNLYKAVIFSRMLENGENPAGEEQELEARQQAAGGGRFSRFLNSSKLDKAANVMKLANAGSGIIGMINPAFKDSKISKFASKGNDIMVLVKSIRGIITKLRDYKKNSTSKTKKAFAIIGLVQDFGMAIAKGASLAEGIAKRSGLSLLGKVLGYLSSFANIAGQMATLIGASNTLKQAIESMTPIKKAQKEEEANVMAVLQKYETADVAENAAEEEDPEEEEAEEAEQGQGENKKAEKGKGKKEKKPKKPKKPRESRLRRKKALKAKVLNALERPDVSKEDKAVLASYLGRERILSKKKFAVANVATGLITATLGLGGSFSKSVAANTEGAHSERAGLSATIFGGLANSSILLSAAGTHIAGKKVNSGPGEKEGNLIKEGLYGALHNLASDDKYGLRKVAANLAPENPDAEKVTEATDVVKKYETASKQLDGSGVNYAQLFKATDKEAFKNSLVASL